MPDSDLNSDLNSVLSRDLNSYLSSSLLSESGLLQDQWPGFTPRVGQQQMARLIEAALDKRQSLVVEAPSGAGKTLAYLLPIMLQNRRAIIATASRQLQHQLYRHDIPLVQKLLKSSKTVAVLQGRKHYLCPYYLEKNTQGDSRLAIDKRKQLFAVLQLLRQSSEDEMAVVGADLPESLRQYATCASEDCLGKQCPQYLRCPLMIARQRALHADIVVVNHSLLFTDLWLRRDCLAELLPSSEVVVIDEAHRIADFAQTILGEQMSSRKIKAFFNDCTKALRLFAPEQRRLLTFIQQLQQALMAIAQATPSLTDYHREQHSVVVVKLITALQQLAKLLDQLQDRDVCLKELYIRNQSIVATLQRINTGDGLCWLQAEGQSFTMRTIPANPTLLLSELFSQTSCSWIFTSATLSVAGNPGRFLNGLGLSKQLFKCVPSEINFQLQAKLYTPPLPVEPDHPHFIEHLIDELLPLLALLNGRVLMLFSSHQSLASAARILKQVTDYPLFVQAAPVRSYLSQEHQLGARQPGAGQTGGLGAGNSQSVDNQRLIQGFKSVDKGLLLGTGSFWEGLDLSGVPLAGVVIDKLPFASPTNPIAQLRAAELSAHGVDSFHHYVLPEAVIRLRQGCGRLLRRRSDRGVIMIADPRLHSKDYGDVFIKSLPAMQQVYSIAELHPFFQESVNEITCP